MFESFILGAVQGVAEWLPISSEAAVVLTQIHVFGEASVSGALELALFLHLGTFFAALVYFRKDVLHLLRSLIHYRSSDEKTKTFLTFLIYTTVISGLLAALLVKAVERAEETFATLGTGATIFIGCALLVTALLLYKAKERGERERGDVNIVDTFMLGAMQGLAVIPGISRSGSTVALLLLRKIKEEEALKISFLMSLPLVLAGSIALNLSGFALHTEALMGLLGAFLFGLLTIHALMKIARRLNFAHFVLFFALLTFIAAAL